MERRHHKYKYICTQCEQYHSDSKNADGTTGYCDKCNRYFFNQTCFDKHLTKAKSKSIYKSTVVSVGLKLIFVAERRNIFVVNIFVNCVQNI